MSTPCIFLDRDGVINVNPAPGNYIRRPEQLQLIAETADWIRILNALDYLVIVVTNQRGIALGLMSEQDLEAVHMKMIGELAALGARIDDVFYCPHEEDACDCRKPRPGMIFAAVRKWDIDLARSAMIGDSPRDEELATRCGLRFIGVREGRVTRISPPPG